MCGGVCSIAAYPAAADCCMALGLPELATVVNYCYVNEPAIPVIHQNCGDPPKLLSF